VQRAVPGATLLLAGRGTAPVASGPGIRVLGEVPASADLLSQVAVLAFPCPTTSGPKMKSLEAMAHGVPLLTTAGGIEGLPEQGARVVGLERFAHELVALLRDPHGRAAQGARGLELARQHHSPTVATRARLSLLGL
jgi:hypothetical protein